MHMHGTIGRRGEMSESWSIAVSNNEYLARLHNILQCPSINATVFFGQCYSKETRLKEANFIACFCAICSRYSLVLTSSLLS